MKNLYELSLKILRNLYFGRLHLGEFPPSGVRWVKEGPAQLISEMLQSRRPCMIARFGSSEMLALASYWVSRHGFSPLEYIRGNMPFSGIGGGGWNLNSINKLCETAGFFPKQDLRLAERFCELMLQDIPQLDILASWLKYESLFDHLHHAHKIHLCNLEPFDDSGYPWSQFLEGRKVLVVHPFAETIRRQYESKRELLFKDKRVLPPFNLKTIRAVQGIGDAPPSPFGTWFDALEWMKEQIDLHDYDICLIGCGAFGFPLAAHVKRRGKQAVHMGGALQLLFGIKGKRWTEQYGPNNPYLKLFNEHWVFPSAKDKPQGAERVENACYW